MQNEIDFIDEIAGSKRMTLHGIAEVTGAAYSTIAAYAQKAGWTKNGKETLLNEKQTALILEAMKNASNNQYNLPSRSEGIETSLTPALKAAKIKNEAASMSIQERIKLSFDLQANIIMELSKENTDLKQFKDNTKAITAARHSKQDLWARFVKAIQKYGYEKEKHYNALYVRAYKELQNKHPKMRIQNKADIIGNTDLLCEALEIAQGWE
jgi:hypothetical protein